jgi:ABC-type transport system involved in cytochrome bd biosynthesis fused ATPase/permease subunit
MVDSVYNNGYFLCFLLILLGAAVAFAHHHAFFHAWRLGMQLRGALTTIIYDKSIRLSLASMASISVGHIVNLTAQDVESFQICGCFVHFAYTPLLEALAVLYFGIAEIGVSFVAGFACIILLVPLQKVFSAQLHKSKSSTSRHTDERLKVLNQALNGVRLMKISGWEDVFIRIIEEARKREVAALLYTNIMRGLNEAIFFAMPIMIACFTFVTFVRLGGTLSTAKIFIVFTYFNIVQFSMTKFFSMSIAALTECHVAIRRIERLLLLPEVQIQQRQQQQQDYGVALEFDNFSASWTGVASSSSPPQGEDVPILDKKPVNATATEDEDRKSVV